MSQLRRASDSASIDGSTRQRLGRGLRAVYRDVVGSPVPKDHIDFVLGLESHCIVDIDNRNRMATTQELFASWSAFARANNEPVTSMKTFSETLQKRGFLPDKNIPDWLGKKARGYRSIELRVPMTGNGTGAG